MRLVNELAETDTLTLTYDQSSGTRRFDTP